MNISAAKLLKFLLLLFGTIGLVASIILWVTVHDYEPFITVIGSLVALFGAFAISESKQKQQTKDLDQRNRGVLLSHVENFWVKGILEKSLHGAVLIELDIRPDPDAVSYPWPVHRVIDNALFPANKDILDIFEEVGSTRSMLILGEPGSGKTTMLLELTRQLIKRARRLEDVPIPIVFNLSSWGEQQNISDWLIDQLNIIYKVPEKTSVGLIENNKLMLFLDGLDEVKRERQSACVHSINQFRLEHGLTSLVICCRSQEYAALDTQLEFEGAIAIQPLTPDHVNQYLTRFGKRLTGLKAVYEQDHDLQELLETPLMLSIVTLAYLDVPREDIRLAEESEPQRAYIFDTYLDRMFERPGRSSSDQFSRSDTLRWLSWLASKMIEYNQVPFLVERLQPEWLLENRGERRPLNRYRLIAGLGVMLLVGLSVGLVFGIIGGLDAGLQIGLLYGLNVGLMGVLGFGFSKITEPISALPRSRRNIQKGLIFGLSFWLSFGLMGMLIFGQSFELMEGLIFGLSIGLFVALPSGLRVGLTGTLSFGFSQSIEPVGALFWSQRSIKKGLILGLIVWLVSGLGFWLLLGQNFGVVLGLIIGLSAGLITGLFGGLVGGVNSGQINQTTVPNQGIRQSLKNALLFFTVIGLLGGLLGGSGLGLIFGRIGGLTEAQDLVASWTFIVGMIVGPMGGLFFGGEAVVKHYILRWLLARSNYLPKPYWHLVPFLNHATNLIFLSQVGGGYIFVHRLLMEHFAAMQMQSIDHILL